MSFDVAADQIYYQKLPVFRFRRAMGTKKNLFDNFNEEDSISPSEDAIKVFLRLKPSITDSNVIQVLDSKTLLFKMPQEFMQARNKLNISDQYKYSFSHIYPPNTTQSEIYTGCVAPLIKDLFNGQHCLLFTYGTTNAGKTFTVLGNGDNPGIIPRTLTTVFKSILGKEYKNDQIMPDKFNSALEVTDETLQEERNFKAGILTWKSGQVDSKLYKTSSTVRSSVDDIFGESVFREMQKRLTNDTSIVEYTSELEDRFSVWVSFAEIYNEAIYDLLQPVTPNMKRKPLKLGQDNNKNYYIKGLKHIFVQSEEEAYKVLMFGKTNLQVAATGMNSRSSRSHCIFTIKLIKSPNVEHPERVIVSSFSICDLAGAERQKKTLNVGLRLKESQNINCSLHVLSRCFTIIRENQASTEPKMIPFRDSKLTQLFKHALTGKENVTMIVNVNSDHQLCEETQHVLKASAIAKHIVVQPRKLNRPKRETRQSMFSQIVKHNRSTLIPWDSCVKRKAPDHTTEEISVAEEAKLNDREEKQEQYENLLSVIEELKDKLKEEKAKHNETKRNWIIKEEEIRKEVKEELTQFLEKTKEEEKTINLSRGCMKIEGKQQIDKAKKRRLLSPEEHPADKLKEVSCKDTGLDYSIVLEDLQNEVKMQQKQIDGLTDFVNLLRDEKKELGMELALARNTLGHRERDIANLRAKLEMLGEKSEMHKKYLDLEKEMQEKLTIRDELLNEAKEDLLAELRAKDDLEDEISKIEKEFAEKEEELLNQIEELKQEVSDKEDQIELLEAQIENMEYVHADKLESLMSKIEGLEEELARLSQLEDEGLSLNSKLDLEKQISTLTTQKEELSREKVLIEEQLTSLAEEHSTFKLETDEKFNTLTKLHDEQISKMVKDYERKLQACDDEIKRLNAEIQAKHHHLDDVKEELDLKINEIELNKLNLEKKEKDFELLKTKLESEILHLTCRLEEGNKLSVISNELKSKCQLLQEAISKKSEEIDSLEKLIESLTNDKKKIEEEYRSEISTLEQSCKNQLQETTRLWNAQRTQGLENERLTKELSKLKNIVAGLNESLKVKEHELECCKSKMIGYEKMVPTLQSQFDAQKKELLECQKIREDQKETIISMEKDLASFQENQKEIIGKYENNLKKTKEENESLKKEVARVTTTFYKSTPTPKKVLQSKVDQLELQLEDAMKQLQEKESYCEKLKKSKVDQLELQLEDAMQQLQEKESYCEKLKKENERLLLQNASQTEFEGLNKENESIFKRKQNNKSKKQVVDLDIRHRALSCANDHDSSTDTDSRKTKSASKARTRTTRATSTVPTIKVSDFEDNKISENKPKKIASKSTRKKLYEADSNFDDELQFGDDEQVPNIPQDSPRTYIQRSLRNRHK